MGYLIVVMPDGSEWSVAVEVVAQNRALWHAKEYGGEMYRSLEEDTMPLFNADSYEIHDWAANNMNWSDVASFATQVKPAPTPDYQEGWVNGAWRVEGESV